jgi:hypothetical protein
VALRDRAPKSHFSREFPHTETGPWAHWGRLLRRLFYSAKRRLISWLEPVRIPLKRQVHGQLAIVKAATVARALSM